MVHEIVHSQIHVFLHMCLDALFLTQIHSKHMKDMQFLRRHFLLIKNILLTFALGGVAKCADDSFGVRPCFGRLCRCLIHWQADEWHPVRWVAVVFDPACSSTWSTTQE